MISQVTFGTYRGMCKPAISERKRIVAKLPHHGELGLGFRERKAHALKLRDRPLEGEPFG
jgi:hypothetical protein